ncbi:Short-chain dehydrogenase [Mycena venus]|uniref:Short-chain dehydrogenase n=1 Tax=Mycena venus TaxID=2733690 RepID=A0A8H7CY12_9AGAR|nr:Short-chain dehydrogenase [Mycena venus]
MVHMTYTRFLREQWGQIPLITGDLSKRAVLLTGAGSGLGFYAATHLASMRPRKLLLTHRDVSGLPSALLSLSNGAAGVIPTFLDLTSFASVKKVEDEAIDVDTFVGNAAMATRRFVKTEDGWETALQVNYLSNALLCILLLPHLIKNGSPDTPSRVIFLSSDGHHFVNESKLPPADSILDTLNDPAYCTPGVMRNRYDVTKTLLLMFADELAARLPKDSSVSVMNVNPGFCHSRLTRETESKLTGKILVGAFKRVVARPTEEGSRTIVHAVVTPEPKSLHGQYITACQIAGESDFLASPEGLQFRASLWRETVQALNKADPRVGEIVEAHLEPIS